MLGLLRRATPQEAPQGSAPPEPPGPVLSAPSRDAGRDVEVVNALEADVLKAIQLNATIEAARAGDVDTISLDASRQAHAADQVTKTADNLAKALGQSFVTVIRQSEIGDRRQSDRFPVERPSTIHIGRTSATTHLIDISTGGVLVAAPEAMRVVAGQCAEIDTRDIGRVGIRIVASSSMGLHCGFERQTPEARGRVDGFVAQVEATYKPRILLAQETARRVEILVEQAVRDASVSRDAVLDTDYRPLPGTDPAQYSTASLGVFERIRPPVLENVLASDPAMAFCLPIDRNGYIPVHDRAYSQPQRADAPIWNAANCRNKRIFDDRAGITAARSTRPFVIQAYARDMGAARS